MLWAFRQLFVPFNYLRIRQGSRLFQSKAVYDFVLPALLTALTLILSWWLGAPWALHDRPSLAGSLSNLFALLIAFYMAALAAVATFERTGIDENMKGEPALLRVLNHQTGVRQDKHLTYRQFISYLFGYLSFLSLVLFVSLIFFNQAWPLILRKIVPLATWTEMAAKIADGAIFIAFFFGVWQMFVSSILGIYFLTDRMQTLTDPHQ